MVAFGRVRETAGRDVVMDRRRLLRLSAIAGAGGVIGPGVAGACGPDNKERVAPTKITLGDILGEANPHVMAERFFAKRFAELTDHRFVVDVRPGAVLGEHVALNDLVRTGKLQIAKSFVGNLAMFDRCLEALSLPWTFTSTADMLIALDGRAGEFIKARLAVADIQLLGFFNAGPRNVYNTVRPIRTPGDLRGMRLRVPQDTVSLDAFNACGARAVPLAFSDISSAIRNRFVDGAENSIVFYATIEHDRLARIWSWTRHQVGIDVLIASKRWFGELRQRDRAALVRAVAETVPYERRLWQEKTETYTQSVRDSGVQMNDDVDVPAFRAAVAPVIAKYRPSLAEFGSMLPVI